MKDMHNMKYASIIVATVIVTLSAPAFAFGPAAVAGAQAVSGAIADADATGVGIGGNQRQGQGQSSDNSVTNKSGDSTSVGAALAQAPTALSVGGICGKGTKFVFGALEWSDYSSKCFNYMIAMEAAKRGEWSLANQWVERADGM